MQAGIHHEAHRAQLLVVQPAEPLVWIGEHPEFLAEILGIERPALDVGRVVAAEAAELRQVRSSSCCDRALEVVAGRCLVQRQRLHAELRLRRQVEGVDVENAGPRAVRRRALVEGAGRRLRAERLHLADLVVGLREHREELRQRGVDAHLEVAIALHEIRALREVELRIRPQVLEESLEVALEADLPAHAIHLAEDARDLVETDLVDLLRRHVGRRVLLHAGTHTTPCRPAARSRRPSCASSAGTRHARSREHAGRRARPCPRSPPCTRPSGAPDPRPALCPGNRRPARKTGCPRPSPRSSPSSCGSTFSMIGRGCTTPLRHSLAHVHDRLVHEHDESVEALAASSRSPRP